MMNAGREEVPRTEPSRRDLDRCFASPQSTTTPILDTWLGSRP